MRQTARWVGAVALGMVMPVGPALPADDRPQPPEAGVAMPQSPDPSPDADRAALRARIERRLAEMRTIQARLEDALRRLEQGEATENVRLAVEPGQGMRRSGRPEGESGRLVLRRAGPPGPEPPPPHVDVPPRPLPREAVIEFVERHNPALGERLRHALQEHPQTVERILARLEPHVRELLAERDPQTRELRLEEMRLGWQTMETVQRLSETMRREPDSEQAVQQIAEHLRELLERQFDVQLQLRQRELAVLEERLAQVRRDISERVSEREAFVQRRLEQAMRLARERASRPGRIDREDLPPRPRAGDLPPRVEPPGDRAPHRRQP